MRPLRQHDPTGLAADFACADRHRPLRLVYLGTPQLAVPPLRALVDAGHDVGLVVTRPDRRRGRGGATSPSPVAHAASELGLRISHDLDDVVDAAAELGVVVAYGRLIGDHILRAVPMINVHFSLLPRWRGAAPVERALLAGDTTTGVSLMAVERELDAGGVFAQRAISVGPRTTAAELRNELVEIGSDMLVELLSSPLPRPTPQSGDVTYAAKIDPAELRLDWTTPAAILDRVVRLGGAWTTFRGRRLKVLGAEQVDAVGRPGAVVDPGAGVIATGAGGLRLDTVQPEGKAPMRWSSFANGARPTAGEPLGD